MARPRVFVSSTFYDLKYARDVIEGFIQAMGFDPVLNEHGHIPYGSQDALEKYCYKEIDKVHILVSIIGGRFGAKAQDTDWSISHTELSTAIKLGKQVYVFVQNSILSEYQTYLKNKAIPGITYTHVDNPKVYEFLESIYALPFNNQIAGFDNIAFITSYLKEQWAGLFEQYLEQQASAQILDVLEKMENTTDTLRDLVELLKIQSSSQGPQAIKEQALDAIIIQNHPLFLVLKRKLSVPYRVFFTNVQEMDRWLLGARRISPFNEEKWDDKSIRQYYQLREKRDGRKEQWMLKIPNDLFDDFGNLKAILPGDWDDKGIGYARFGEILPPPQTPAAASSPDDEIPF